MVKHVLIQKLTQVHKVKPIQRQNPTLVQGAIPTQAQEQRLVLIQVLTLVQRLILNCLHFVIMQPSYATGWTGLKKIKNLKKLKKKNPKNWI